MFGTDHKVRRLQDLPFFAECSPAELKAVASTGDLLAARSGDRLEGPAFFLLMSGEATLDGGETLRSGDSYGAAELLNGEDGDAYELRMATDGDVLIFGKREFSHLLLSIPSFWRGIGRELSLRLRNTPR